MYKLRIRESEKLKTVLELYDLEIHQKKLEPDYHRLKTMVKRSIKQEIRNKNFENRNKKFEKNAVVKNQGTKQRVQRILGDCGQWETNGQCVKGDNCSFRHDTNKRGKVTVSNPSPNSVMRQSERKPSRTRSPRGRSPSGRMSRWPCKDYLKGTCNNSFCEKWHPPECLFYKTKSGCRFGEKCSCAHCQFDEQPSKRCKKNDDKSAVAILKKHELHDRTAQPVVNRDKSHDGTGQPVVNRDTRHESNFRTCWVQIIEYTTIGLRLSGYGAAEVDINLTEELPTKRSKTNNDKSAVALLKKGSWQERESVTNECHDRPGKPGKRSDKKLGQNSSKRQFSDARQLGCVFQDMTPPKSILRKGTDMPKPIQRVNFTKAIARHAKIRNQNPSL